MNEIRITGSLLHNEAEIGRREWLITNGIGGFSSSSLVGANTRGYHGLLFAALKPPLERMLLVSKLDEKVLVNQRGKQLEYNLATNIYQDGIHPKGYTHLVAFKYSFHPTFIYEVDGRILEKKIYMVYGENTTIVEYTYLDGYGEIQLQLTPYLNYRDYHGHMDQNDWPWLMEQKADQYQFAAFDGAHPVYMTCQGEWIAEPHWRQYLFYPIEAYRGLKATEDHYVPGYMRVNLLAGQRARVIFSTLGIYLRESDADGEYVTQVERLESLFEQVEVADPLTQRLLVAADQFVVHRQSSDTATVIAGYPWFTDWGRDSMIALPGLTLVTGRYREAREILKTFAKYSKHGLIPNRFPDEGEAPEYNTVDATLWFIVAFYQYYQKTQDRELVEELLPLLTEIINFHQRGTIWGIQMEADGLLTQGEEGVQLTWMDAKVDDWVVTPRQGKVVEINALWYNALKVMEFFCTLIAESDRANEYARLAEQVLESFQHKFWIPSAGYLADRIIDGRADKTIRPNQIFALSLPFPLLDREQGVQVLNIVREHLLTPFGLRSLSPDDPDYHGHYGGDQYQRDSAYHRGTVWGWLLGPYLGAFWYVRGEEKPEATKSRIKELLEPLLAHLMSDGALGQLSEIFDGDRPYHPRGCYAQAWTVAEVLRIKDLIQ